MLQDLSDNMDSVMFDKSVSNTGSVLNFKSRALNFSPHKKITKNMNVWQTMKSENDFEKIDNYTDNSFDQTDTNSNTGKNFKFIAKRHTRFKNNDGVNDMPIKKRSNIKSKSRKIKQMENIPTFPNEKSSLRFIEDKNNDYYENENKTTDGKY